MTYCVGMLLQEDLVMASDSRTNAGVDDFARFCKMSTFERSGDRVPLRQERSPLGLTHPPGGQTEDHETDL